MKIIMKKHRYKLSYLFVFLILLIPPICFADNLVYPVTDAGDIFKVLKYIFANKTFKNLPTVSTALKTLNCSMLVLFFFSKNVKKYFNIYVFCYMLFITLTQYIAYVEGYGLVISAGSFILMLVTCLAWLFKFKKEQEHITVNKRYLWLLIPVILCIWYPLNKHAQFDFGLNPIQHYFSSSMYCFNMPVFMSFLLIFYKDNIGGFYEVISLIGLVFGLIAFFVNLTYQTGIPNAIMHIPLIITSLTLFLHSFAHRLKNEKRMLTNET